MIRGGLFTRFFLEDGIRETSAYRDIDPTSLATFAAFARDRWHRLAAITRPSEAETESEFIFPLIERLGWLYLTQQEPGRGRRDIADALLFTTEQNKSNSLPQRPADRFRQGAVVVENEARETPLDRASGLHEAPSSQILRYLGRAEAASGGTLRWGLLTNGRFWRLYSAHARARAEGFIELDLPALLGDAPPPIPHDAPPDHWARVFLLLFRAAAHIPDSTGTDFLDLALAEGRRYEERVTAALSAAVFDRVFPDLLAAIFQAAPEATPNNIREAGLRLLYRLLFLFYAEDRDLLPVQHEGYRNYALRGLRDDAAAIIDDAKPLSARATTWWPRLQSLFAAIAEGDASLGLPPYNGGLFDNAACPLLDHIAIPDAILAPLIDAMSRETIAGARRWINYRDLSVQQLGSIYERLLERAVIIDSGGITLRLDTFARKDTGSYYTPDELVQLVLRRTIGPLLEQQRAVFRTSCEALAHDRRPIAQRLAALEPSDPAQACLSLRICDPAMGSGHFLVSLVDYLADTALTAIADAAPRVTWADYRSPLARRLELLRTHIKAEAATHGWVVRDEHLDDRHLVRRIILKRVIYGVDANPMAVELAKLSLWLHSFTVGAPLSFLDHHLRCGDSLFGEFTAPVEADLRQRYGIVVTPAVARARAAAAGMGIIEDLTDADIGEVKSSATAFAGVEEATAELRDFLSLYHASRWIEPADHADRLGREFLFGGVYGDPVAIAAGAELTAPKSDAVAIKRGRTSIAPTQAHAAAQSFVAAARNLAQERRFLHWEAAFPGVWDRWGGYQPGGGFDAVIGNPPWDRMKLQEVEWFAARVPAIAHAQRASERKRMIAGLRRANNPVVAAYDAAIWSAEAATRVARGCEAYPLLSSGDVNLYSLFVERAARLVRADGLVGVLIPSGIAADLGAAKFFRGISTTGRLATLFDFENRRTRHDREPFFPDVDSRFKFCALVFGGADQHFAQADCAFFQQDAAAAEKTSFPLTPADFATVNPNTGTAPVFRTSRDAALTRAIYQRLPVLIDRSGPKPVSVWPVRYFTMFHMTNDSDKFHTRDDLTGAGAYQVQGGIWEHGDEKFLPLYEGKMVQAYDHRAASVTVNPENLNRQAQPEPATDAQHENPNWLPEPQFFVAEQDVALPSGLDAFLGFKDITSPTNMRTMIATLIPRAAFGNTLPLLLPDRSIAEHQKNLPLLIANFNSLALDYVARQKVQGNHLNYYIVEQLPIIPDQHYTRQFGPKTADQIVCEDVLHLTYNSHDMAAFARSQGCAGPPFPWDETDRLRRRARLDALYFLLYGITRDDADYILTTFPIVAREETARWGKFRSRDLILAFMAALVAGNPDAKIAG